MRLELSDRAKECTTRISELTQEYNDYQMLVSCIKALQAVEQNPQKYNYSDEDYNTVISRVNDLCARHEIRIPDGTAWASVDIV